MWHWVLQSVKASKERKKIISCQRSLKQNRVEKHNLQGAEKLIRCQQMLKLNAGEKHKLVQSTEKLIRWLIRCQRLLKLNRVEKHKVAQSAEKLIRCQRLLKLNRVEKHNLEKSAEKLLRWLIRCQWLLKLKGRVSCLRYRFDTGFAKRRSLQSIEKLIKCSRETQGSAKRRETDQVTNQVPMIAKSRTGSRWADQHSFCRNSAPEIARAWSGLFALTTSALGTLVILCKLNLNEQHLHSMGPFSLWYDTLSLNYTEPVSRSLGNGFSTSKKQK